MNNIVISRLELEVQKYREKLADMEFYKARESELRDDNRILLETQEMLEEQLAQSRLRADKSRSLEHELMKMKQKENDAALVSIRYFIFYFIICSHDKELHDGIHEL